MSTNPVSLKYPYQWAKTPVNAFVERYPRGTYFLSQLCGLSPGELRHLLVLSLAKGKSLRFESFKRAIRLVEDYSAADLARFSVAERKLLYKWIVYLSEDIELDRKIESEALDKLQNRFLL